MLQIVTKKFFRDGVPLHSRPQRRVLYTNRLFLHADVIALPVGELAPSNDHDAPAAVTTTVIEHLEAQELDGSRALLISTGGEELVDQLADVLSFTLHAVFTRDRTRAARLVPPRAREDTSTSKLFRRTFDCGMRLRLLPRADEGPLGSRGAAAAPFRRKEQSGSVVQRRARGRCAPGAIRNLNHGTASVVDDETGAPVLEKAHKCVGAIECVWVLLARVIELRAHHVAARRRPRKHGSSLLVTLLLRGRTGSAGCGSSVPLSVRLRNERLADDGVL
jgi:hypothetical protein